jgi:hypothetical protein
VVVLISLLLREHACKLEIGLPLLYVEAEFNAGCLGDAWSPVTREYQIVWLLQEDILRAACCSYVTCYSGNPSISTESRRGTVYKQKEAYSID